MSQYFHRVASGIDTLPLVLALRQQPDLWGQNRERIEPHGAEESPHAQTQDIWVRANDRAQFDAGRPWVDFVGPHESVWYPAAAKIPQVRPLVFGLMARVEGEQLGGVLITRTPRLGSIAPHVDHGWSAAHYDKYYVALDHEPGAVFRFPDGDLEASLGDVWWFRNDVEHQIINGGERDRLAMIVSIASRPQREFSGPLPAPDGPDYELLAHEPDGDGVAVMEFRLRPGGCLPIHDHTYTHKSLLASGTAVLTIDGENRTVQGPLMLTIEQGRRHALRALTQVTWLCIHAADHLEPDLSNLIQQEH